MASTSRKASRKTESMAQYDDVSDPSREDVSRVRPLEVLLVMWILLVYFAHYRQFVSWVELLWTFINR